MIDLIIKSERNEVYKYGPSIDINLLDNELKELAKYVDPYGNTVFNYLQIKYFLDDIQKSEIDPQLKQEITDFCDNFSDLVHHYLWLIGD